MSGLQITVTPAGLAAIVNAENTGTDPVLVNQIGVSSSGAGIVGGTLDGEIKRLVTFAGAAVADDTIHLTIRDDTADVYTLRAFALYLADGTLFAWYAQAGVILEKSVQAMMLLAADVRFVQIDATSLTFGDTDWINPPATTEVQGVIEVATNDESLAGDDPTRAVPPAGLKHVLDQRFGAGAPSVVVKGLLALATAAAIRVALEIKSAALKDEGAGNGLDADKLDGQHGTYYLLWANLTGKPSSFPPSAHTHVWADITDPPSTATRWPAWAEVTSKPATFPPSSHTHAAADITSGTLAVARIPALPISQTTNLQLSLDAKASLSGAAFTGAVSVPALNGRQFRAGSWANASSSGGGDVVFSSNCQIWSDNTYHYDQTHPNLGASGIVLLGFADAGPYFFDTGDNATTAGEAFSPTLRRMWHAGNFDPGTKANLTGAAFTGAVSCVGVMSNGYMSLSPGNTSNTGYLAWYNNVGTRCGYLGFGSGTTMLWNLENGFNTVSFNGAFIAAGGFQSGSSRELKDIDGPLPYGLAELLKIETAIGSYREGYGEDHGRKRLFVIAEQLAEHVREPVFEGAVEFDGKSLAAVDYTQLVPLLIRAVQDLAAEVRALKAGA